ncbi:hypothetical protein RJ55_06271 [Drechmeria coniospora]|nr:hypothetical protein RJ55_06271 [Drechmeria coniospora]
MPKKRQRHFQSFKPSSAAFSAASSTGKVKPQRGVNELLSRLRLRSATSAAPPFPHAPSTTVPSVPPSIGEILQLPETPAPLPRRRARQRFDHSGRRLPAGPPPPRNWATACGASRDRYAGGALPPSPRLSSQLCQTSLPGVHTPEPGCLIDIVLRHVALNWEIHRVYDQYHLYFLPSHLKPTLLRYIGKLSSHGVSVADLQMLLLPPEGVYDEGEADGAVASNADVTCLDLCGSLGRSLRLKDLFELLFPSGTVSGPGEVQDSWEDIDQVSCPPRVLLPNLTHLSLALDPHGPSDVSWKQLLTLSTKLSTVTHLDLAFWPEPCLTPRSRFASFKTPQGLSIPAAGTNYYSHTLDNDWSKALLVLRTLSHNLYKLEFLDLTGCTTWFKALMLRSGHDFVDWAGPWSKLTVLRLSMGWTPTKDGLPSERAAYRETSEMARLVERHIVAQRAGKGHFITVERDTVELD